MEKLGSNTGRTTLEREQQENAASNKMKHRTRNSWRLDFRKKPLPQNGQKETTRRRCSEGEKLLAQRDHPWGKESQRRLATRDQPEQEEEHKKTVGAKPAHSTKHEQKPLSYLGVWI